MVVVAGLVHATHLTGDVLGVCGHITGRGNMPYKYKEDRTEAVRRHRARKADKQLRVEKAEQIDASLGGLLLYAGFQEVPFEDFLEVCKNFKKDRSGVWRDGKHVVYPPEQVFLGLNTMVAGRHLYDQVHAIAVVFDAIRDYIDTVDSED